MHCNLITFNKDCAKTILKLKISFSCFCCLSKKDLGLFLRIWGYFKNNSAWHRENRQEQKKTACYTFKAQTKDKDIYSDFQLECLLHKSDWFEHQSITMWGTSPVYDSFSRGQGWLTRTGEKPTSPQSKTISSQLGGNSWEVWEKKILTSTVLKHFCICSSTGGFRNRK